MAKKILIIEDERMLVKMYEEKFENEGFEVALAFSAREALEILKKEKPDLILLDILLPKENGIQFLKSFREIPEVSKIPVVAFSNFDDPLARKEAEQLGVKDYLIKTEFTPAELIEKVKEYLPR